MSTKKICGDYLMLLSTYGNRGATEILCDRSKEHKGHHSGITSRRIGHDEETEEDILTETRVYWDNNSVI